ncbi:hypothetical protein ACFQWF_01480 [Methylorubrum suomiense]
MPELRKDQIQDLGRLFFKERRCIHGGEPGTGKTPTICVLQRARWDRHGHKSIWLMPMKLIDKNFDEAMLWGEWAPGEVAIVDGSPNEVEQALTCGAKLLLMGFTRFELVADRIHEDYKAIDIDEWHKGFGGHDSKRTQALYRWCKRRGDDLWFVPMTGTSYNGRPSTVYPALQVIEPRYYGTPEAFSSVHDLVDPFTRKVVGHTNLDRLETILSAHSIKRLWTDVHGPEEIVVQVARCRMNDRQRRAYDKFRETALLELEQFFIDGTQPGVGFIRARQIMEHPNSFPDLVTPASGSTSAPARCRASWRSSPTTARRSTGPCSPTLRSSRSRRRCCGSLSPPAGARRSSTARSRRRQPRPPTAAFARASWTPSSAPRRSPTAATTGNSAATGRSPTSCSSRWIIRIPPSSRRISGRCVRLDAAPCG